MKFHLNENDGFSVCLQYRLFRTILNGRFLKFTNFRRFSKFKTIKKLNLHKV